MRRNSAKFRGGTVWLHDSVVRKEILRLSVDLFWCDLPHVAELQVLGDESVILRLLLRISFERMLQRVEAASCVEPVVFQKRHHFFALGKLHYVTAVGIPSCVLEEVILTVAFRR
uniref:(northern house mosquito) hypothetical protein n=1 Tax=Culex pipiens TaxID=7175 RepID=A0A8D8CK93_CULPI